MGLIHSSTMSLGKVPFGAYDYCKKAMDVLFRRQVGEFKFTSDASGYIDIIGRTYWSEKDKKQMEDFVRAFRYGWEAKELKEKDDARIAKGEGLPSVSETGDGCHEGAGSERDDDGGE